MLKFIGKAVANIAKKAVKKVGDNSKKLFNKIFKKNNVKDNVKNNVTIGNSTKGGINVSVHNELNKAKERFRNISIEQRNEVVAEYGQGTLNYLVMDNKDLPHFQNITNEHNVHRLNSLCEMMQDESLKDIAIQMTQDYMTEFMGKYFKELAYSPVEQKRIDDIIKSFEGNLADMYDFVDYVTQPQFTNEYDSDSGKNDADNYYDEMVHRVGEMEKLIITRKYK